MLSQLVTDRNFDLAYSEDAELGHAFAVPFDLVIGKRDIPVIPFFTNVYVPPLPTPRRCAALGRAIAEIIRGRKERVAIIASGGMSHFPGTTKYLHPEFDFDRWLVSQFEAGNPDALLNMTNPQLDEVGNTSPRVQARLLRALESQEVRRVGGNRSHRIDVRVIAASNRDIKQLVIPPDEAYGVVRRELIRTVPRQRFPEDVELYIGKRLNSTAAKSGRRRRIKVIGINSNAVIIDANHPLAGKVLKIELELLALDSFSSEHGEFDLVPA